MPRDLQGVLLVGKVRSLGSFLLLAPSPLPRNLHRDFLFLSLLNRKKQAIMPASEASDDFDEDVRARS